MAGSSVLTNNGRDQIVRYIKDKISYFKLGEGGCSLSGLVTEVIDESSSGWPTTYDYTVGIGEKTILSSSTSPDYFEISGDFSSFFTGGMRIIVEGSSGNDGIYTVNYSEYISTSTFIYVSENVLYASATGTLRLNRLPIARGPIQDSAHYPLIVYEILARGLVVQTLTDTTGSGNLTGDGTGTINYKSGALHVQFASQVSPGSAVIVEYKHFDVTNDPTNGEPMSCLFSEISPVSSDGERELFTIQKSFGSDADNWIQDRGDGFAKIRCHMKLQLSEGNDDGRSATCGGSPFFSEGGIFDEEDVMLVYFTFDVEKKSSSVEWEHRVDFVGRYLVM